MQVGDPIRVHYGKKLVARGLVEEITERHIAVDGLDVEGRRIHDYIPWREVRKIIVNP